jgi:hypothetical protein
MLNVGVGSVECARPVQRAPEGQAAMEAFLVVQRRRPTCAARTN